jgi:tetratricopeptide (TPR) repeat protein
VDAATPTVEQALALLRAGRADEAAALLSRRLRADPVDGAARHLLGVVLLQLGRGQEALRELERAARLQPGVAGIHYNRGNALAQLGRDADAVDAYDQALLLQPAFAEAAFNRGNSLHRLGLASAALESYRLAVRERPSLAPAQLALGRVAIGLGRDGEAVSALESRVALEPADAEAWNLLGVAHHRLGELVRAQACFDRAIELQPGHAHAWNNRGNVLHDLRELEPALACYARAVALDPGFPAAVNNRGMVLQDLARFDEARSDYDRALQLRPGYREALRRRAALSLLQGRLREGWADYEAGHAAAQHAIAAPGAPPFWEGQDLRGKALLLSEPNGLGDTLQFFRFVPRLLERGVRLAFLAPRSTFAILSHFADRVEFIEDIGARRFDYQCWLWSLPHHLGVDSPDQLGLGVPWLQPEPERAARWRAWLSPDRFNIGVCWQGNPRRKIDRGRSIPLRDFAPLAAVPGVRLVSLQKGHGLDQLEGLPAGMRVDVPDDYDTGPDAFLDTAAMIAGLDLVVSADTAVTHVAGAMGRPAWVALNPVPDWRWMLDRPDSPWYPSVRLFRQPRQGDWPAVFEAMAAELEAQLRGGRSDGPGVRGNMAAG